jgi:hypothetical protein
VLNLIVTGGTSSGGSGAFSLNIPTGGTGVVPSPLFSPSETPSGINAAGYVQDVNGDWHSQLGIDAVTTDPTSGPPAPAGTLTFFRRTYFRDTLGATQTGKNAFVSINHVASVGTANSNQDRGLWVGMSNVTGAIFSFSITSNVVTLNVQSITCIVTPTPTFQVGQVVVPTALSTGTYLNNQQLKILSVSGTNTSTNTITAAFTHANVGLTSDTGRLDQVLYSMANIQMEQDIVGSPVTLAGVDTEYSTLSLQSSDQHIGSVPAPGDGINVIRAQYFREVGAGTWQSIQPCAIRAIVSNFSTVNAVGAALSGIQISGINNGSTNLGYFALNIGSPVASTRFDSHNWGIKIDDYGTNVNDFAIHVAGGQCLFGGNIAVGGTTSLTGSLLLTVPLASTGYVTMLGDSGAGGTKGAVPAPPAGSTAAGEFLRADATWAIPPSGTGAVASVDLTAQTANIGATTMYAVPGGGAGMYRAVVYAIVTQAATTSSTLPKIQITWTDKDSSTVQTVDATVLNSGNTLTTVEGGSVPMSVAASTNVQYTATGLATSGATALQYALHIKLEQA